MTGEEMEAATLQQNSRRDWITPAELTALGAIWGGSFLFMRVAAADFGPIALVEVRVVLGALSLMPFLWRVRRSIGASLWLRLAIVGLMNSAIPFTLFAWGAERAPAGVGAIANSMTPLFTALVAFAVWREAISVRRAVALVVGLIGVVVLASDRVSGPNVMQAAVAGTVASLSYGFAANLTKRWLSVIPPAAAVAGTQLCSALMLAPLAFFEWPTSEVPMHSWLAAAALGVLCTGIAYALLFRLIARVGAARAITCTYLIPVFGVGWAWLFLGEAPTATMAVAGIVILGSVIVSQRESVPR
jgi:drug/metabolite transporter (DMT)-like permease